MSVFGPNFDNKTSGIEWIADIEGSVNKNHVEIEMKKGPIYEILSFYWIFSLDMCVPWKQSSVRGNSV